VLHIGDLEIDNARVEVRKGGENAGVTPLGFKLLLAFVKNRGRVLSRDQLIDLAWGSGTFVTRGPWTPHREPQAENRPGVDRQRSRHGIPFRRLTPILFTL